MQDKAIADERPSSVELQGMIELARERLNDALNAQCAARRRIRDRVEARLRRLLERAEAPGRAAEETAYAQLRQLEQAQLFVGAQTAPLRFEPFGPHAFSCVLEKPFQRAVLVVECRAGRWMASELGVGTEVEGLTREGAVRALCLSIADSLLAEAGVAGSVSGFAAPDALALAA